jgi:PhoPQ-activated pathogenicity-related protein
MYPSDLEKFKEAETFAHAYSVAVGSPDERSVPLFVLTDVAAMQARLEDALFVLGMVDKNNRIEAGEKGKAWSGRFVVDEVRRVLAGEPKTT